MADEQKRDDEIGAFWQRESAKGLTYWTGTINGAEIYVTRAEQTIDKDAERDRLMKEIAKTSKDIELFAKKLSNKSFVEKAPQAVVAKDTARLEELKAIRQKLEQGLALLGN